jgi:serine/threonine protein kinase
VLLARCSGAAAAVPVTAQPSLHHRFTAKVSDFGLSLHLGPEATHVSRTHAGTMTHMAPELLLAGRASKASDVYAVRDLFLSFLFSAVLAQRSPPRGKPSPIAPGATKEQAMLYPQRALLNAHGSPLTRHHPAFASLPCCCPAVRHPAVGAADRAARV